MAENSKIEWTDHTFNPWVGCTKISPACDNCYAELWAKRTGQANLWGGERRRTSSANWHKPVKWHRNAEFMPRRLRVFCASLADVFDNAVPQEWREDLFKLIAATPGLDWLLLTKRIGNAKSMLPPDWGDGYPNVWLGSTVVTQEEVDRDVPKLVATPARVRFLSCEPLLGEITLGGLRMLHWVIVGGESGRSARPMAQQWAEKIRRECEEARVPFFMKQGSQANWPDYKDFSRFTLDLQVRQWPHSRGEWP